MERSYSDVTRYQRCPMAHYYATVLQIQPKQGDENQDKGILAHRMLMDLYLNDEINLEDYEGEFVDEVWDLVQRYADTWNDDWVILHVEENFMVELDDGTQITMTPDLIVQEESTGAVWIVDHKTTDRMPSQDQGQSLQALTYFGLLQPFFPTLTGFIFNYLRKKPPAQPRLAKTGVKRVAYLDSIDTTYEILRDFLMEEAPDLLDDPAHQARLAELREDDRFFIRKYEYITDAMIENHIKDIQTTVRHMELSDETEQWHRVFLPYAGPQSCTRCAYNEICVADLKGYDRTLILDTLYEPRDMSHKEYDHRVEAL